MSSQLLVSTRKGLFSFERNGAARGPRWKIKNTAFLADNVSMSLADPRDGALYAALDHGHFGVKLHRSRDGGKAWQEIAAPALPPRPEGQPPQVDEMGRTMPDSVVLVWALEAGGQDEPGVLWCGTIPGGLFRSEDGGDSWQLNTALWEHPGRKEWFGGGADHPGIHSICVDPRDSRRVTLGVSCGGAWQTQDAGRTWQCVSKGMWAAYMPPDQKESPHVQDPHHIVQSKGAPDLFWSQNHDTVFRSTDGAASWQEVKTVEPSVFGFTAAVHPRDGNTAWLVPAIKDEKRIPVSGRVSVARTRDGGKSFDVLRKGLPQRHAYDLTLRHGLDVDDGGDTLTFGTSTGSLWLSEDQGDSWSTLSEHLPPIYGVRFSKS